MAVQRALITLHTTDNLPANYLTNSLYFDDNEDPGTNLPLIADEIEDAYNAMRLSLAAPLAQNGHEIQFYKLSDPPPRVPTFERTWDFESTIPSNGLPSEVALVLSFQAERVSGLSQARRRGRIYLGPIGSNQNVLGRPNNDVIGRAVDFGESLLSASGLADWTWVVYSEVNQGAAPVTNGWVDDSWDTQRRRGIQSTSRTTWGVGS